MTRTRNHLARAATLAAAATLAVGCQMSAPPASTSGSAPDTAGTATAGPVLRTVPAGPLPAPSYPSRCTPRDGGQLPDLACTPGALNPEVTQANIGSTICRSGFSASIRPNVGYTNKIKKMAIRAYGDYAGSSPHGYELDHLVSLELGGAPNSSANLWPEHPASPNPKDKVEDASHRAVCDGKLSLAVAQREISVDWINLGHVLGVTGIPVS
jgi:hypothetical protein